MIKRTLSLSPNTLSFARISFVNIPPKYGKNKGAAVNRLLISDCYSGYAESYYSNKQMYGLVTRLSNSLTKVINEIESLRVRSKDKQSFVVEKEYLFNYDEDTTVQTYLLLKATYRGKEDRPITYQNDIRVSIGQLLRPNSIRAERPPITKKLKLHTDGLAKPGFPIHSRHMLSKLKRMQKVLMEYQLILDSTH